jgi:hypothetical protein
VLYKFGQFQYNIGVYGAAADLLYHFRILVDTSFSFLVDCSLLMLR